jgi:tetrahydromethanopterin:alpha-L-glutamate ligase
MVANAVSEPTTTGTDKVAGLPARSGRSGLRVAIMTDETGWHTRRLQRALRQRGAEGRCIDLERCHVDTTASAHGLVLPGFGPKLPDAVIVRGIAGGSFEQVTRRLALLHALREVGVPVYNDASAIERSVDKAATSLALLRAGVPSPPTWATESPEVARAIVEREAVAGHALVLKPLFGSQGQGLAKVGLVDGDFVPLPDLTGPMVPYGGVAYLQRYVPSTARPGFDWRVLVVGGRACAAMRRVSEHWIHNVAQGATCQVQGFEGDARALADLAERAANALGLDYAGVDLMPTRDGPTVIEVNGVAAWQGLQRVTPFDVARALVDDLLDRRMALRTGASWASAAGSR